MDKLLNGFTPEQLATIGTAFKDFMVVGDE